MRFEGEYLRRWLTPCILLCAVAGLFLVRIANLQLTAADGSLSGEATTVALTEERVTVKAARGPICDRNGTPLVSTVTKYRAYFDSDAYRDADNETVNEALLRVLQVLYASGLPYSSDALPTTATSGGEEVVAVEKLSDTEYDDYLSFLETYGIPSYLGYWDLIEQMRDVYGTYSLGLDGKSELLLLKARYEVDCAARAGRDYLLVDDCDTSFLAAVMEQHVEAVRLEAVSERVYHYPGHATHILGRVGSIQKADLAYFEELGYPLDAIVGVDGAERAFETLLAGEDGVMVRQIDQYGNVVRTYMEKEPVAGKTVRLTIDIDLQIAAEASLKNNILRIREMAKDTPDPLHGEDASAGALVLLSPKNGEILAMASYPTYNLATFRRDYQKLLSKKSTPLLNRAVSGTYAPGSVFKVCTATAALEEGVIDLSTTIVDKGRYTYYDDYQPRCWIYTRTGGGTHGEEDVVGALRDSCNYFFFDVGRQVGIDRLDKWAGYFGLGEHTGVELPEQVGVVAGAQRGGWSAGDTLSAAIGQSVHRYTPLQIGCYYSTLVNGGKRMAAHLFLETTEFLTGKVLSTYTPEILSDVKISDSTRTALISGMSEVIDNGSAVNIFNDCAFTVGGKTGTAEVGEGQSANALFAAFSPQNDPEVVCISVIENGASGTNAGYAVRDMLTAYYDKVGISESAKKAEEE